MTTGMYPPPPPPPAPRSVDFAKAFSFVFEDPEWVRKILVGGLFYLASFLIIGWFFVLGYLARLVRNVINGVERPLPDWNDLGTYFNDGLKLFGVGLVYFIPIFALAIAFAVPTVILTAISHDGDTAPNALMPLMFFFLIPLSLAISAILPVAALRVIATGRFGAAFEFGAISDFISKSFTNYLLALLIYFVANFASQFGIALCCVGVVFTAFWSLTVSAHGFAQAYRINPT